MKRIMVRIKSTEQLYEKPLLSVCPIQFMAILLVKEFQIYASLRYLPFPESKVISDFNFLLGFLQLLAEYSLTCRLTCPLSQVLILTPQIFLSR